MSKLRDQCFKGALCDRTFFALHVPRLSCRADTKSITLLLAALGAGFSRFLVGLRDRALIGVMVYAFARVSAVVSLKVEDYFPLQKRWWLRLK